MASKTSEIRGHDQILAYFTQTQMNYFVIDAIFGTGVRLPISNFIFDVINIINEYADAVVSIDVPSGLTGDEGKIAGNAILATETLAIGLPKVGHYVNLGPQFIGKLEILDVSLPNDLLKDSDKNLLTPTVVSRLVRKRDRFAHKNSFGHTLVLGGSKGLMGALILAGQSALKVGSGLVTALTSKDEDYPSLSSRMMPEVMTGVIPEIGSTDELQQVLKRFDTIVIGPGLGTSETSKENLLKVVNHFSGPLVIDADAINVLKFDEDRETLLNRKTPTIFTPHLGEFSCFMDCPKEDLVERPIDYIKKFVEGTGCSVILKGPCTYLGFPNNKIYVHYMPNSGMATGGSGDVLAGVLGGIFSQRHPQFKTGHKIEALENFCEAACFGVVLHSMAGKHAAENFGERAMVASSITDYLTEAFFDLEKSGDKYHYEYHDFQASFQ